MLGLLSACEKIMKISIPLSMLTSPISELDELLASEFKIFGGCFYFKITFELNYSHYDAASI